MSYVRLFFPQKVLSEITGIVICSLVDIRFTQIEEQEHMSMADYLFGDCDVSVNRIYHVVIH